MVRKGLACFVIPIVFAGGIAFSEPQTDGRYSTARDLSSAKSAFTKVAPLYSRLDHGLNRIVISDNPVGEAQRLGFQTHDGLVQIIAVSTPHGLQAVKTWLLDNGARGVSSAGNLVQAFIPTNLLLELNNLEHVQFVRRPSYVNEEYDNATPAQMKNGGVTSEGVEISNADAWHSSGFYGEGLKVAVIDEGFLGFHTLLGTELPESSRVFWAQADGADIGSTDHGTACAEIIFDHVPAVDEMYFYSIKTKVDVANAIATAQSYGVDVISISLGNLVWSPGDGTGVIADAANQFTQAGGIIVSSAANSRLPHWQGPWNDNNGDDWLDFSNGYDTNYLLTPDRSDFAYILPLSTITAKMVWNRWQNPNTDLDLHLVRWNGTNSPEIVFSSQNIQNGTPGQEPWEDLSYTTLLGGYFAVQVSYHGGPLPVDIEIITQNSFNPFEDAVPSGSLLCPGDTHAAITVAALDAASPFPLEPYSSRGPTNGPGGSLTGGIVKPDISGYSNVSTASKGPRSSGSSFNGTSAACPHVAGAAALVWSAHPEWTNAQVRSYLESNAQDKGPAGKDNDYGYGRLYLGTPPSSCTYSISPTAQSFGSGSSSGSFSVNTQSGCSWTASTSTSWLHISGGSSGSGNGTVSYSVDTNSGTSQRSGTIQVAGKTFTVTQSGAAACTYSISPTSQSFTAGGGTGSVSVTTTSGCTWTAASNNGGWISVSGGASGSGNGTVSYSVASNSSTSSRTGTMTIAGKTFTVTQSGATSCSYSISPTSQSFTSNGGTGSVSVTASSGCTWTAASNNGAWISVTGGASGSGNGTVSFSVAANSSTSSRTGTMTIAGKTFTVSQSGATSCTYSISPNSQSFAANGGTGSVSVTTSSGCTWTAARSNGDWLSITAGYSGNGSGSVSYSVDANTGTSQRSGTLTIAGKTFTVSQSGATSCTYSISPTSRSFDANGGTGSVSVTTSSGCTWTAARSNGDWLSITAGYSGNGSGSVSYSVDANTGTSQRSGTLTIAGKTFTVSQSGSSSPPASGDSTHFAVIAHTTGAANSVWQSSLSITNVSAADTHATLTYRYKNDAWVTRSVTITAFGLVEWADAAVDLFGLGGKTSGVVEIQTDGPVLVAARTFNSSSAGTFGQSLPGATSSRSMGYGEFGIIGPVRRTASFRTNIGVINTGSIDCSVIVYFVDGDGYYVGDVLGLNLAPGGWYQINEAVDAAGIDQIEGAYAVVELQTSGAQVWAYGTVIDNSSGDPTALQMEISDPSGDTTHYAVIAHTTGAANSVWQSSMAIGNTSQDYTNATLTYRYKTDQSVVRTVTIPPFGLVEWADAAVDLFGLGGKTSGVVTIEADAPILVAVRTFNSSSSGTFGQSLPGASASRSMTYGQVGLITPVRRTPNFRTNIGVINTGAIDCTVYVYFVDKDGYFAGEYYIAVDLSPGGWYQINEAISEAGIDYADGVKAVIDLQTPGAQVWAYGTVIDNSSGDPTALQMEIVE